MKRLVFLCLGALFLTACQAELDAPKLKLSIPGVSIGGGGGNFCPPGQAKKGRC